MNKEKRNILIITVATLVIEVIILFFLPAEIPLHFGLNGADFVGSKYILLIFVPIPGLTYWKFICKNKQ